MFGFNRADSIRCSKANLPIETISRQRSATANSVKKSGFCAMLQSATAPVEAVSSRHGFNQAFLITQIPIEQASVTMPIASRQPPSKARGTMDWITIASRSENNNSVLAASDETYPIAPSERTEFNLSFRSR